MNWYLHALWIALGVSGTVMAFVSLFSLIWVSADPYARNRAATIRNWYYALAASSFVSAFAFTLAGNWKGH